MVGTNIMILNTYCFYEIFKQIKNNCEASKEIISNIEKYEDLINFALSFEWVCNLLYEWDSKIYDRLEIDRIYLAQSIRVNVDFNVLYKRLQQSRKKEKDAFWNLFMNALKSNTQIEELNLIYNSEIQDHGEILDMLMSAIQDKQTIKWLLIDMQTSYLDRLPSLRHLTVLTVNAKINASDLVDCCKSNRNLTTLNVLHNEMYGKLTDIVPYCEKLKDLSFAMKPDSNDFEYTQFAKLQNLSILSIEKDRQSGSIEQLLKNLATKKSSILESLSISSDDDDMSMDISEIQEACRISSLENIDFSFNYFDLEISKKDEERHEMSLYFKEQIDATDLASLSNLEKVKSLRIGEKHQVGTLKTLFKEISSKKMKIDEIFGESFNNQELYNIFQIKSLKILECECKDENILELPKQLPELNSITIQLNSPGSLKSLIKALVQQKPSKLKVLNLGCRISYNHLMEILKIDSLTELRLQSFNAIKFAKRSNLKIFTVNSISFLYDSPKTVSKFVRATNLNMRLYNSDYCVSIDRVRVVALTDVYDNLYILLLKCSTQENCISASIIEKIVKIKTSKYIEWECFDLQSLLLLNDLKKIKHLPMIDSLKIHNFPQIPARFIFSLMRHSNKVTLIGKKAKIVFNKNLCQLTITSNVIFVRDFSNLFQWSQLRSLRLIVDKSESLSDIFSSLAANKNSTIEEIICGKPLSNKEIEELLKITSLKRLECGIRSVKSIQLLSKFKNLEKLTINDHLMCDPTHFLVEILLPEHCNLQSLTLVLHKNCVEEPMIESNVIETLHMMVHQFNSPHLKNFQHLAIKGRLISCGEMLLISNIRNLRKLGCILTGTESIKLLAHLPELIELSLKISNCDSKTLTILSNLNLTHLEIDSSYTDLTELFQHLSYRPVPVLQSLKVIENLLISAEINAIAQLKSLKKLQLRSNIVSCLSNLTNLEDFKLIIFHIEPQEILNMLKTCHKLTAIHLIWGSGLSPGEFLEKTLSFLKTVRNPQVQPALRLRIDGLPPREIANSDERYLIVSELRDEFD